MNPGSVLLVSTVVIPLAAGVLALAFPARAGALALGSCGATLVACALTIGEVRAHGVVRHAVGGHVAPLGIELRADGLAAVVLAVIAVVSFVVCVYMLGYLRDARALLERTLPIWLFACAALDGLVVSRDLFNLYVTLELTTLAALAMLTAPGSQPALRAGLSYLFFAFAGSLAYLAGVVLLYAAHATLDLGLLGARLDAEPESALPLALITMGLCLKAGLFPLHVWIAPAYASATAPVAAALAGLVGKAPFYVLLRVWLDVFPASYKVVTGPILGGLASLAIVWGSILALRQTRLFVLLAYSSVAQVGYLFMFFPLATSTALAGSSYQLLAHAVAKSSLFMAAGAIEQTLGDDRIDRMQGLAQRLPFAFFAIALSGTSLIGVPPSGGFIAKWLLLRAALEQKGGIYALVILLGSLLAAGYVFRVLRTAFLPVSFPTEPPRRGARTLELCAFSLSLLALVLGLASSPPLALLEARGAP